MFTKEFLAKNKDQKNNQKSVKNNYRCVFRKISSFKTKDIALVENGGSKLQMKIVDRNCR